MTGPTLIDRARQAFSELCAASDAATMERDKLATFQVEQREKDEERKRLRAELEEEEAIRLIDGDDAAPRNPRRDGKLAKLDREAAARTAAIRLQETRVQAAAAAAKQPQVPFVSALLDVVADVQGDALESAKEAIAALAPHFAKLIAADQIRNATIGESFPMPAGVTPPFGGLQTVRKFAKEIPARLRPAELSERALFDAAHEISAEIIRAIKEPSK